MSGVPSPPARPPKSTAPPRREDGGDPTTPETRSALSIASASASASATAARIAAASAGSILSRLVPMISAVVRRGVYSGCAAAAETAASSVASSSRRPSCSITSGGKRTPLLRTWSYTSCRCGCLICCAHSRMSTRSFRCTSSATPVAEVSLAISWGTSLVMTMRWKFCPQFFMHISIAMSASICRSGALFFMILSFSALTQSLPCRAKLELTRSHMSTFTPQSGSPFRCALVACESAVESCRRRRGKTRGVSTARARAPPGGVAGSAAAKRDSRLGVSWNPFFSATSTV